jgi:single-strand DNA-binding protein
MRSTNLFIVRGYTGADAKPVGKAAKVSIATTRVWYDDKNAKVEKTDWVTVTILNEKAVAFALANVKKGDPPMVPTRRTARGFTRPTSSLTPSICFGRTTPTDRDKGGPGNSARRFFAL